MQSRPDIQYTQDPKLIEQLGTARVEAWYQAGAQFGEGFLPQRNQWLDEIDFLPKTHHWVVFSNGQIAGAARLSHHESFEDIPNRSHFAMFKDQLVFPTWALSRLFVKKEFWGHGYGRLLDEIRLRYVAHYYKKMGVLAYACGERRFKSLERYGFDTLEVKEADRDIIIPKKFYVMVMGANDNIFAAPQHTNHQSTSSIQL